MTAKRKNIQQLIDLGLPPFLAARAHALFGDAAIQEIERNPYELLRTGEAAAWEAAEKLAHQAGFSESDDVRWMGAIRHVLISSTGDGHVYLPLNEAANRCSRVMGVYDEFDFNDALERLLDNGDVIQEALDEGEALYSRSFHRAESLVADKLAQIATASSRMGLAAAESDEIDRVQSDMGVEFASAQREAVEASLTDKIVIITGGPGTGKTTIIRGILHLWDQRGARIMLAAPTGRASRRLGESTGRQAFTIHRLLEYNPETQRFGRDSTKQLKCDLIVIDESSMIDIELMMRLVDALPSAAHVILVGDVDQLPAVGPGLVLHHIIESECIRTIHLTEIFRQQAGSLISLNALKINDGEMPELDGLGLESGQDFFFINRPEPQRAQEAVIEMATERIPRQFGLDSKRDVQVLCPMIRRHVGVESMNLELQKRLNPSSSGVKAGDYSVSVGDKIMQTRNDYSKDVFNGDIGFVVNVDVKRKRLTIDFEGRETLYHWPELINTSLAYAMTIHKSQGSEFPAVIIPVLRAHYPMLQRNLIYTAVSRGKSLVILAGDPNALEIAIRNNKIRTRFTALKDRLFQAFAAASPPN